MGEGGAMIDSQGSGMSSGATSELTTALKGRVGSERVKSSRSSC